MTIEDWIFRYKERFVAAGLSQMEALDCAHALNEEELQELIAEFEDDPEGAAEMEMSYWEP